MKTILIVDDDPIIVQVYRTRLQTGGYRVEVADDGLAAMKIILELRPDLIVLDVLMPKVEGTYVLKFIRSRPDLKGTKVIVLSNASNADVAKAVLAQQPDQVFLKSQVTPRDVLAAVNQLLDGEGAAPPPPPSS